MSVAQIIGIVLIIFGAYVLVQGFSFTTKEEVVDIGPVEATADEEHMIPPWSGAVIGGVGLVMVVAGGRRRQH